MSPANIDRNFNDPRCDTNQTVSLLLLICSHSAFDHIMALGHTDYQNRKVMISPKVDYIELVKVLHQENMSVKRLPH